MTSTNLAISKPTNATKRPLGPKRVRISPKLRQALDLLASGECKTQRAAAARANLSEEHISRMLATPQIQSFIAEKIRRNLERGALRASSRLPELVDAVSEQVSFQASRQLLIAQGHIAPESSGVHVNTHVNVGYVIDWRSARNQIGDQTQDEPKPLAPIVDVTPKAGETP